MVPSRAGSIVLALATISVLSACAETPPSRPSTTSPPSSNAALPANPAGDATPPGGPTPPSGASSRDSAPPGPIKQTDPDIELRVLPGEGVRGEVQTAEAIVTFRTGGWTIVTDSADVIDGKLLWRVTIVPPAPGEMVTQALVTQTLSQQVTGGPVLTAELHARLFDHAESAPGSYRIFASWP
jgi:hypothetical protein